MNAPVYTKDMNEPLQFDNAVAVNVLEETLMQLREIPAV